MAAAADPPARLVDLLDAFESVYLPSDFAFLPHAEAHAHLRSAELRNLPSVGLSESLTWDWTGGTELIVAADLNLPVYSTLTPLEIELARAVLSAAAIELEAEHDSQLAAFLGDLIAAALFDRALAELTEALASLNAVHPLPHVATAAAPAPSAEPRLLAADRDDRAVIELVAATEELRAYLASQLAAIARRVARAAGAAGSRLAAEVGWGALLPELLAAVPHGVPSDEDCLASAPTARLARQRFRQAELAAAARATPQLRVQLGASASYSTATGVSGGAALSAELSPPPAWVATGSGVLEADLDGVTQRLAVRWPTRPAPADPPRTPRAALAIALDDVLAIRLEAAEVVTQAAQRRELSVLRLAWFAGDALGLRPDASGAALLAATAGPHRDPVVGLQAAELRARLTFADLALALARIDLASHCGWRP